MNKILKWILIVLGFAILSFVGFWFYEIASFSGAFEKEYSAKDLIENYNAKTQEIIELNSYIKSILPSNKQVDIEFDGNNTLAIFHVIINGSYDSNWDIDISSKKTDILLKKLGWTKETLSVLKDKLDKANCISVISGETSTIGYQRSNMGKYSYKIFSYPLNDSLKNIYNDSCTYIYYKENIVLEYGGGVIGPPCFSN